MLEPSDLIRRRAYERWEAEGRPQGRDLDHWLAAEAELARDARPGLKGNPTTARAAAVTPRRRTAPRKPKS